MYDLLTAVLAPTERMKLSLLQQMEWLVQVSLEQTDPVNLSILTSSIHECIQLYKEVESISSIKADKEQ